MSMSLDVRTYAVSVHVPLRHEVTWIAMLMPKADFMQLFISPLLLNPEIFQNFSHDRII